MATVNGTAGNDSLGGSATGDLINGLTGNDRLFGLAGNDTLHGGSGNDTMTGGAGDDFYVVEVAQDSIVETGGGTDAVLSFITFSLARTDCSQVERVILQGTDAIHATGNALDNLLAGNTAANRLDGVAGKDSLFGGAGNDTLIGGTGSDGDRLDGGDGNDRLDGGGGNDTLSGGKGVDTLSGGAGDDFYIVESADFLDDKLVEATNGGSDSLLSFISLSLALSAYANVEKVILQADKDLNVTGNARANLLSGNVGDNQLDGGAGNDSLFGGGNSTVFGGNDTLSGGAGSDLLSSGNGNDRLDGGEGNDSLFGGSDNDSLVAGAGNDTLAGDAGADTLVGGTGNDTYFVDVLDVVTEAASGGTRDRVISSTLDISLRAYQNIEDLYLNGDDDLNGYGNDGGNLLQGNDGDNTLDGRGGNDTVFGGDGGDVLIGRDGNDYLDGGEDADVMAGGSGDDTYEVDSLLDSINEGAAGGTLDRIVTDNLDLSLADYYGIEVLHFTGTQDLDGAGSSLGDILQGNGGKNILDGRAGNDTLLGGLGDDSLSGGTGSDILNGNEGNDTLLGGDGGDVLVGHAGIDQLLGGAGSDALTWDILDSAVNGGADQDELRVTGSDQELDLIALDNLLIQSIEVINLNIGEGENNTLRVNASDVKAITASGTLFVVGDADATVESTDNWQPFGQDEVSGQTFNVYLYAVVGPNFGALLYLSENITFTHA